MSTTGPTISTRRVLDDFTKETGIKVRYDTFDSNDTLETKLLAGNSGYDVVVPTAYFLERQIKAGVFQKLDKSKLPNLANALARDRRAARRTTIPATNTPSTTCGARPASATTCKKARERARRRCATIDSWDDRVQAGALAKFKDCGVHMLDSSDDILPAALHYLGLDPNSTNAGRSAEGRRPVDARSGRLCANFIPPNISTRWRPAKSASWSAFRATSSRRKSAPPRRRTASRSAMRSRKRARNCGSTISPSRRTRRNVGRGARADRLSAQARGGGEEHEFHFLRQRQSGEPEIHRQGDPRRPDDLSGRRRRWPSSTPSRRTIRKRSG